MNDRRSNERRQTQDGVPQDIEEERRQEQRRSGMDRRAFARIDADLWVEQEHGEETVYRLAGNLSAGGIFLEHGLSYPVGTRVKLRFTLGEGESPVELSAEVVNATAEDGTPTAASLSFSDLRGEDRERIIEFLNRHGDA